LLADFDISDEHDVAARLDDLLLDLQRTLGSIFNFNAVIGCSDLHRRLEELRGARLEAEEALEGRFFNPSRSISHYDGAKWPALSADYGKRIKKLVFNALKSKDYDPLRQILDRLFEDARSGSVASPMNFKQLVVEIVNEIDSYLIDSNNRNIRELLNNQPKPTAQTIIDFKHIDTLQAYILEIVGKLPAAARNINVVPVVERTKRYIHENYMNSISLSDISRQFEVSDGYLCRLFKEKTGENLFYYISRIRIEKSIELMETTDLSTNEIAEKVGYENANYFIKVFKKITQKTVSEFKHGR
jgi:two-component system response regulator YesN